MYKYVTLSSVLYRIKVHLPNIRNVKPKAKTYGMGNVIPKVKTDLAISSLPLPKDADAYSVFSCATPAPPLRHPCATPAPQCATPVPACATPAPHCATLSPQCATAVPPPCHCAPPPVPQCATAHRHNCQAHFLSTPACNTHLQWAGTV